jgi:hypothetical protein
VDSSLDPQGNVEPPTSAAADRVVSPEATGGVGVSFEGRVGAIALSRLLRGDRIPGLDGPPKRVRLQQLMAGAVLDDIVIDADDRRGGEQTVEYQVKRTLAIASRDPDWLDIVRRCVDELGSDPDPILDGHRQFGIASRPTAALSDLDRVVRIARAHGSADTFVDTIQTTAGRGVRDRLAALRAGIIAALPAGATDVVVDDTAWRVARAMHVWAIDAEPDAGDVLATRDRLADLLAGRGDPDGVFRELVDAANAWGPRAATVDVPMLREHLERKGVALSDTPTRRAAFHQLEAASRPILDQAGARLGHRLHLPRQVVRRQVRSAVEEHQALVLAGPAGVGKSIMARLVAADLADDGAVVVAVNLAGRTGPLALLEQDLGASLADGLRGAPIGHLRVLVIDGAEQALTDGSQLLSAVLNAVPVEQGAAPPWNVVLTARLEAVPTLSRVVEDRAGETPGVFHVGELEDQEVAEIVENFPRLAPVDRNPRARALLLRRPYLVELLVRAVDALDLPGNVVGEEDVVNVVNTRLIRLDQGGLAGRGAPYARADIFVGLGAAVIANALPARLDGTDPEARAGLSSDDIITEVRSSWRFAHDVLSDYATVVRLLEPDGADLLAGAPNPRLLLRAARLRFQYEYAEALAADRFTQGWRDAQLQAERLAARDGPRWNDVPWEALLHMGAARAALDQLAPDLLAGDATGLRQLIDVTERRAWRAQDAEPGGAAGLDTTLSAPVVDLLVFHGADLPAAATGAALQLTYEHLHAAASRPEGPQLEHIAELPDAVMHWAGDDQWGARLKHAVGALALCGAHLEDRHDEFLLTHARTRPHEIAEAVEGPRPAWSLAQTRPDLLLRLAGLYYLGRGLTLSGEDDTPGTRPPRQRSYLPDDEEGVRDHSPHHRGHLTTFPLGNSQSNPALGPYTALLAHSPAHGLRLIGAVVDGATAARSRLEATFGTRDLGDVAIELTSPDWDAPRRFDGPATVWMWHRRTSVGPGPALSALMALRAWAAGRIREGDAPRDIRGTLLGTGTSLAFVSVALSVLVDRIDDVNDELDLFLVHPLLWHLELARVTHEHGGTALDIPDAPRLGWNLSNVAMLLVLRADPARRERLRALGEALIANHAELGTPDSELLARRWAAELDADHFVAEAHDEGVAIKVDYPTGVVEGLRQRGDDAARALELSGVMFRAVQIRDGDGDLAEAAEVWASAVAGCEAQATVAEEFRLYTPGDILCAAAAALVLAAAAGADVVDSALRDAVAVLLEGAAYFGQMAPPTKVDYTAGDRGRRALIADMCWDMGADRSIATALPVLLFDVHLRERVGVSHDTVADALESVAASPYDEARQRLVTRMLPAWGQPCHSEGDPHRTVLRVARRLVATEGVAKAPDRYEFSSVMLAEPLEEALRAATGFAFEVAGASFGVVLAAAAHCDCEHGAAARRLVDAVIDYDHRVWPADYARHNYHGSGSWRQAIDAAVADRVIAGDDAALDAHLDALASVGEELRGFLEALITRAVDTATAARLHDVWPSVLDHLLPAARNLAPSDGNRDREPYHRDVEDLDAALLPIPTQGSGWPVERTLEVSVPWFAAFQGAPHVADRAIEFIARILGLRSDLGTELILSVLGNNINSIRRSSRLVVAWLKVLLSNPPPGAATAGARTLLDQLAAGGDENALGLQQELEA